MTKEAQHLASNLAGQKDSLIRVCINEALGNDVWVIGDLAYRMRRVRIEGQESETFTLDGKPLLEIWPPTTETVQDGDSVKIVATCKYRTFTNKNAPDKYNLAEDFRELIAAASTGEELRRLETVELPHLIGITDAERAELKAAICLRRELCAP